MYTKEQADVQELSALVAAANGIMARLAQGGCVVEIEYHEHRFINGGKYPLLTQRVLKIVK